MINNQEFLEYAKVFDHYYGTPKEAVEEKMQNGCDVLFDIDWQARNSLKCGRVTIWCRSLSCRRRYLSLKNG